MELHVRKWLTVVEEIADDGGPQVNPPLRKAAVAAVIANPYAGRWSETLDELTEPSGKLAVELVTRAKEALGVEAESCGKGAIVGVSGEQEHGVACLTTPFGDALRDGIGGNTWVTSNTKVAAAGTTIDIPLAYKTALFVREFYDTVTVSVPDGPRPDEIVVIVALASRGRVHSRLGGLAKADAKGDGLQ
ncbi:amino acid synthesis family protein [Streptosporangium sp. 'caverna']|uniref:amino acid synthesis family protein n=1 Tax=Streptosporangium sp. 'caverna' TaxID=2202249 RepID=UPI000D7D8F53|nr:amino acid synthesis family protein [Streptosporangium sp. 'caverna']AWS48650.1 peptide synthetase [Streptosporangium sp. 'caverna']